MFVISQEEKEKPFQSFQKAETKASRDGAGGKRFFWMMVLKTKLLISLSIFGRGVTSLPKTLPHNAMENQQENTVFKWKCLMLDSGVQ